MLLSLIRMGAFNPVVAYTVHEPPEPPADPERHAESLRFVKDGFNWLAFLLTPVWMLSNRLWLALVAYLAAAFVMGAIIGLTGAGPIWSVLASLALSLIVALEADGIMRWSLARKGWRMIGAVEGASTRECERRFFERWLRNVPEGPVRAE